MAANNEVRKVNIELPASKSISNRLLILKSLFKEQLEVSNLSTADDTRILADSLNTDKGLIDVGMAGTAFRFLTAFYAFQEGERILTGSERMKNRPIAPLVDALKTLGADIEYLDQIGFPPLRIIGVKSIGGEVEIDAGISSQFVSALMLVAPKLKKGLKIKLKGSKVSGAYITMTAELMKKIGVDIEIGENYITLHPSKQIHSNVYVENDWSSASFFYNYLCCSRKEEFTIFFPGLKDKSIQGDATLMELYQHLGVETNVNENSVSIHWNGKFTDKEVFDFSDTPDLIQPFLVSCSALNRRAIITGAKTLRFKETNRVKAMKSELRKIGAELSVEGNDKLILLPKLNLPKEVFINTYNDHRMAMSFAGLFEAIPQLEIEDPKVVNKSFPNFWREMKKLGMP